MIISPLYPAKAAALAAVIFLLVAARVRRHRPFARFGPANQVTSIRAMLTALVAALVGEPHSAALASAAVAGAVVVTLLDGIDGWIARRSKMVSPFGARFDNEVDALLILALATLVWSYGKAGPWVLLSGLLRYLFVGAGWIWDWMRRPLSGSARGKIVCITQIVGLMLALAPFVPQPLSAWIAAASLAALIYSFAVDTLWLWRHA